MIPDLKGPQNDLTAMETLVRSEGATDVTVLSNDMVTRTSVETAFHALGLRSKPGDWIVFYYSGHGAEAQAAVTGTADGDRDQFVPLPRFDIDHQDAERFIVDKDFYAWMDRYIPRSVQVFMIADTCHSGTLYRSIDPRAFHFTPRLAFRGNTEAFTLIPRPGPQFPGILSSQPADGATRAAVPATTRADLPNVIYMGAAQDDQLAIEASMPVEGAPSRGILTYAFEHGLTTRSADGQSLAADLDHDGKVSISEIAVYVDGQVRMLSGERQQPHTAYATGKAGTQLFALTLPDAAPAHARPATASIFAPDRTGLALLHGADAPWAIAADAASADFVWDIARGSLLRRSGDTVAQGVTTPAALRGTIEKWNAVESLRPLINEGQAALKVGPDGQGARYRPGATVNLSLDYHPAGAALAPATPPYATIFDMAADGTIQSLYPLDRDDGDGRLDGGGNLPVVQNRVVAPYGVDHVIAVLSDRRPDGLRALIKSLENQRAAGTIAAAVRRTLADPAGHSSMSIVEIYTGN